MDGTYDQAFDLSIEATENFGWYNRNTGFNPFTAEGKKTAGFEIWEQVIRQLPKGSKPLTVFVPVGDGNIISGVHKGFKDLQALGWLPQMPRIIGVQSEGSAAIANTFNQGDENIKPVSASTLADSISVDLPRDGVRAVRAARETGGTYLIVPDQAILNAIAELGKVGIFAEPAAATAYAGLVKAVDEHVVAPDDPILVLSTGSGLKDVKAAMQAVHEAPIIEPTLSAVKRCFYEKPTFSIIAPIYNELENIPELYPRVRDVMDQTGEPWELILVDDGSKDGSTDVIRNWLRMMNGFAQSSLPATSATRSP